MRDQVCIILNEREPAKHAAAASISDLLKKSSITVSRLDITEKIVELAVQRCPKIMILDYLLGDFTTGLDIVYALNELPEKSRPIVFFLTDEPSVRVAVEAMLLGVKNYFQLDRKDSIPNLCNEITNSLSAKTDIRPLPVKSKQTLDNLIAQSSAFHTVIKQANTYIKKNSKLIFIMGESGSGKTSIAEAIQEEESKNKYYETIDLKYFHQGLRTFDQLKEGIGIIIENAEEDNGEVLAYLTKNFKPSTSQNYGLLIVTSSDKDTMNSWKKQLAFEVLEIPPLKNRKEDITQLIQSFTHLAETLAGSKVKRLPPEIISSICELDWPGHIQQLKSVIIDTLIEGSSGKEELLNSISSKSKKWLEYNGQKSNKLIDGLIAARAVEMANHNYRIAAVKLGCSLVELHSALNGEV